MALKDVRLTREKEHGDSNEGHTRNEIGNPPNATQGEERATSQENKASGQQRRLKRLRIRATNTFPLP
ncbi:hypothetical protein D5086_024612 [Populus alba]|uniref:Uncharacterized protein n=1 Tax=Populus alba TaxID=43335 RepID=A0ACC4B7J9_POPAL